MISSARRIALAAAVVAMGSGFAFAADQPPANEQGTRPPPRQVDQKEVEKGRAAAKADIAKKLVRYTIVAQPTVIDPDLKRLAASKYNILIVFQGCCPTTSVDYDRAYMEVALEHLKATYGSDPVAALQKELWEERK